MRVLWVTVFFCSALHAHSAIIRLKRGSSSYCGGSSSSYGSGYGSSDTHWYSSHDSSGCSYYAAMACDLLLPHPATCHHRRRIRLMEQFQRTVEQHLTQQVLWILSQIQTADGVISRRHAIQVEIICYYYSDFLMSEFKNLNAPSAQDDGQQAEKVDESHSELVEHEETKESKLRSTNPFDHDYEERGIDVELSNIENKLQSELGYFPHTNNDDGTLEAKERFSVSSDKLSEVNLKKNMSELTNNGNIQEDEEKKQEYENGPVEKFINYIFCRGDLSETKLKAKPTTIKELFKYGNKADKTLVILGIIVSMFCGICQPMFAIVTGRIANVLLIIPPESDEFVKEAFLQFFFFNVACVRIVRNIRAEYLRSILRQDSAWLEKNHSGSLNTHLNDNIDRICEGIGDKFGLLVRNGTQYCTGLAVAFYTSWQMAAPLCILSPIIAAIMGFSSRKMSLAARREMGIYAKAGCIAEEAIGGIRTVAAFNAQEYEVKKYEAVLKDGMKTGLKKGMYSGGLSMALIAIIFVFMGSCLLYGSYLYKLGVIENPGDIFVVLMAIMSGAYHLGQASPHLMVMLNARIAASTVYNTIDRKPKIDAYSAEGRKIYNVEGKIVFKKVSFRYPSRKDVKVLRSLSLNIQPGQTIALVGHSGSGKSTCVGILNRLYEYESGQVTIDGHDIRELNVKWLRTVIGTVQQHPVIFNDTVENNLKVGNVLLNETDMVEACKMANAHQFIESLPNGYQTRIGEGGVQLSGGQKQRIAIARTLARDPKILLLDEATSALDAQSEATVQVALKNASKGRTTIIIAHRLSTVKDADKIIVLNKGKIMESGTHLELMARQGQYHKLVRAQQFENHETESQTESVNAADEDTSSDTNEFDKQRPGTLREDLRMSYKRDFMSSEHLGDAETEAMEIELKHAGGEPSSLIQLFNEARKQYRVLLAAFAFCFINAVGMPLCAVVYGEAFAMFNDGNRDAVEQAFYYFLIFTSIGLLFAISAFFSNYLFGRMGETLTFNLRVQAFRSILKQDGAYFDNPAHTPGKLITRLATDAPNVKAAVDTRLSRVVQGVLSIIVAIIISTAINWKLAACGSLLFIIQGIFQFFISRKVHSYAVKVASRDEAGRLAVEAIENVQSIQLITAEHTFYDSYVSHAFSQTKYELMKAPLQAVNWASTHGLQYFTVAFCYFVGFLLVINNMADKIIIFQVVQTMYFGSLSVQEASIFFPEFVKSRLAAGLMFNIINSKPANGNSGEGERTPVEGSIQLEKLYFAYPQRPKNAVLKGLSLNVNRGHTVALVGSSGSGKSTVIQLLQRFYEPSAGIVKYDGQDIKNLSLEHIRTEMSIVSQEPVLFSGTVKENIAYGLDIQSVAFERIEEAAAIANATAFINTLPHGYETYIGEKGSMLSGGQKQRIAIARAIIRNPRILLLDEATSALDTQSEKAVQEALERIKEGRTCIVIAHRLTTIQNADLIVVMDNGRVSESGNHASLMAQRGKYFKLIQRQTLSG
ncbi:hypothetical protein QR680_000014 [Steinernema hermaphroditum]|uniref:ABC-type xenobiotic transporter n=1 Tax=Steinernema hermaphroditum TaxID=289476 RepID=A0AA39GT65_9BILA|nr:hypothetical protein QR680_000014 [Steinernema hermaphroditum]